MEGAIIPPSSDTAKFGGLIASQPREASGPDEAIAFLRDFDPRGRHNLVAINPAGGLVEGRTFDAGEWEDMRAWIAARDGRANLYFTANEPDAGAPHAKLQKHHIARVRAVFADIDPDRAQPLAAERKRLWGLAGRLVERSAAPSFVVDSGGGIQPIWRLRDDLDPAQFSRAAEDQGRGIAFALGGDAVQNIDRILRLPGTINIPSRAKRASGRTETPATLLASTGELHSLEELGCHYAPRAASETANGEEPRIAATMHQLDMASITARAGYEDLPNDLRRKFDALLARDEKVRRLWAGDPDVLRDDTSGSAYRAKLADALGRAGGFTAEEYAALVRVWDYSVQAGDDREAKLSSRAIARDWERIAVPASSQALVDKFYVPITEPIEPLFTHTERSTRRRFEFEDFNTAADRAIAASAPALIKGLLDQGAFSVMYGDSNAGKTFVAMDLAFHIATGRPYAGMRTARMPIVYLATEGGGGVRKRVAALRARYPLELEEVWFHLLPSSVDLLHPDADLAPLIDAIAALPRKPGLIVVDTLSRALAGGDENASTDMGGLVRNLDALRAATSAHLMVVHHSGKDRAKGARGHSLLRAALDTELEVADGVIRAVKQRDLDMAWSRRFRLEPRVLGADQDGDPISSCTVTLVTTAETLGSDWEEIALQEIKAGEWRKDVQARDAWVGVPIAGALGLDPDFAEDRTRLRTIITEWIKAGRLVVESRPDAKRRLRAFVTTPFSVLD